MQTTVLNQDSPADSVREFNSGIISRARPCSGINVSVVYIIIILMIPDQKLEWKRIIQIFSAPETFYYRMNDQTLRIVVSGVYCV